MASRVAYGMVHCVRSGVSHLSSAIASGSVQAVATNATIRAV